MKKTEGVSIIIPAFNEERNIRAAIGSVVKAVAKLSPSYEVLVVNDGSSDNTKSEAAKEESKNKNVRVIDLERHMGLGYAIQRGVKEARLGYTTVFPGDNDMDSLSLTDLLKKKEKADLVVAYMGKSDTRKFMRRFVSLIYVGLVSILFKLKLEYYNGPFICKTKLLKKLTFISSGFTIYAELKIRLIKAGYSYIEIPFVHKGRQHGASKALTIPSIINVLGATFLIWKDMNSR